MNKDLLFFFYFPFPSASFLNLQISSEAVASCWRDRKQTSAGILVESEYAHNGNIYISIILKEKKKKVKCKLIIKTLIHTRMHAEGMKHESGRKREDLPLPLRPQFKLLSNKHPSAPSKCSFSVALI